MYFCVFVHCIWLIFLSATKTQWNFFLVHQKYTLFTCICITIVCLLLMWIAVKIISFENFDFLVHSHFFHWWLSLLLATELPTSLSVGVCTQRNTPQHNKNTERVSIPERQDGWLHSKEESRWGLEERQTAPTLWNLSHDGSFNHTL